LFTTVLADFVQKKTERASDDRLGRQDEDLPGLLATQMKSIEPDN